MRAEGIMFARFTREEEPFVQEIVSRGRALYARIGVGEIPSVLDLRMDLAAVHAKHPLRLADFASAKLFDFSHDLGGIRRHLDRKTGELQDCFLPRFAKQ